MHAKYGPIVRINPYELHVQDSEFYDTLYSSGGISRKKNKWTWDTLGAAGVQDSTLSTIDHDVHRMRRSAIAPFFSSGNVRKLEPVIQSKVSILLQRLLKFSDGNGKEVLNLSHAFSAFTNGARFLLLHVFFPECFCRLTTVEQMSSWNIVLRAHSTVSKLLTLIPAIRKLAAAASG
jgi:hypothetical protein